MVIRRFIIDVESDCDELLDQESDKDISYTTSIMEIDLEDQVIDLTDDPIMFAGDPSPTLGKSFESALTTLMFENYDPFTSE